MKVSTLFGGKKRFWIALAIALGSTFSVASTNDTGSGTNASASSGTGSGSSISASQVENQPNLMILLSNSASMSEKLDSNGYATAPNNLPVQNQCPADYSNSSDYYPAQTMNDGSDGACGGSGTYFPYGIYGGLSDSKFYVAKQVLYKLLTQGAANGINLGFATYRQAMGMQLDTVANESNAIYPYIYLPNQTPGDPSSNIGNYTQAQLANIASNPYNFGFVDWWTIYNSYAPNGTGSGFDGDTDAFLGNGMNNEFQSAPLFGAVDYLTGKNGGGLPYSVQFPTGTLQNSSVSSGQYEYSYYGPGGLTPSQKQSGMAEPDLKLCKTYYDSQGNDFQAIYVASLPNGQPEYFQQSFPDDYNGNQLYYQSLDSQQPVNGVIAPSDYEQNCNYPNSNSQVLVGSSDQVITNQFSNGSPAYFDYIPNTNSGVSSAGSSLNLAPNEASGWSGATSVSSDGTITASYPSTPQPESILGSYDVSGAKWMGPFVNLPSPSNPVNNAPIIANLVNPSYPMENPSGLEYSYSKQTIESSGGSPRSIVNSTESSSYNGNQEPLYTSLLDAYAYWQAFEQSNPVSQCQDNNMLVIFDGVSDGDPNLTAAQEENALITEAKALYNNLHVKIYVIAIATNSGAIKEANALAAAGGTQTAFTADNATQLYNDVSTTFTNISHESINAALSTTPTVIAGSQEFAAVNVAQDAGEGDLVAYNITNNGTLNSPTSLTPLWDANSIMTTANRTTGVVTTNVSDANGQFLTSGSETSIANLAANYPGDFQLPSGSSLTATDVANYTINPSYDSGAYLGGRQNGWWIGLPANNAPTVVTPPDNGDELGDSGYLNFAGSHANRQDAVVFADNDGLVYAVGFNEGTSNPNPQLLWAWMPNGLIPSLQGYANFWQGGNQDGGLVEIDAASSNGVWHSYIVGAAANGNIFYDLQLGGTTEPDLSSTVAEYDLSDAGYAGSLAMDGPPAVWPESDGQVSAAWTATLTNTSTGTTTPVLVLMDVATGNLALIQLDETPTSMPVFDSQGNLYFASGSDLYQVPAATMSSLYAEESALKTLKLQNMPSGGVNNLGNIAPYPSGVNTSINRLQVAYDGGNDYLVAESSQGMSVLKNTNGSLSIQWLTTTAGAETLKGTSLVAAPTSGTGEILPIPSSATISDAPQFASGDLILPVAVAPSGSVCGVTTAEYILYTLQGGLFPSGAFISASSGAALNQVIDVGYGSAYTPSLSAFLGKPLLQGSSANTNSSEVFEASVASGLPLGGAIQSRYIW